MRPIWTGSITFGLVTIPVRLFTAVSNHRIEFDLLHASSGERIRYKRVDEKSGREVDWDDIVKGYEVTDGTYVTFTHEELSELDVESMRVIDIDTFVDLAEIDPVYYDSTYYIEPREGGEKAYRLLARALTEQERVGIAKFAMRQKEHLCALRVKDDMLVLETMHWPAEIREPDLDGLDAKVRIQAKELDMAKDIVDQLTGPFEPSRYRNTFEQHLKQAAQDKLDGKDVTVVEDAVEATPVDDLMAALEASLTAAKAGRKPRPERKQSGAKSDSTSRHGRTWLLDHSKDELLELAQQEDVAGRSKMTKDELVDALVREAAWDPGC